jgi:hypothetical protein
LGLLFLLAMGMGWQVERSRRDASGRRHRFSSHGMTPQEFYTFWQQAYLACPPINHLLKWRYPDRWMRIHSLPDAQRYPATPADWDILLTRQNQLCRDLLGEDGPILLVGGDFWEEGETRNAVEGLLAHQPALAGIALELGWRIDLHRVAPDHFEPGLLYDAAFSPQMWHDGRWDKVLQAIANDELRLMFVSLERNCIVAPYDGGVDVILADEATRDLYKGRYAAWLCAREDGL